MEQKCSDLSSTTDISMKNRPSRVAKSRLPHFQKFSFTVGHFLNDAVFGAWISYLIIFETKVIGLSNRTAGFLWIIPGSVDAVLCLGVGYICDNYKFPLLSRYYGKRKSFHLLGTVLVAGLFPFLMMPCFDVHHCLFILQDTILAANMTQRQQNVLHQNLMEENLSCILPLSVDSGETTRYTDASL